MCIDITTNEINLSTDGIIKYTNTFINTTKLINNVNKTTLNNISKVFSFITKIRYKVIVKTSQPGVGKGIPRIDGTV